MAPRSRFLDVLAGGAQGAEWRAGRTSRGLKCGRHRWHRWRSLMPVNTSSESTFRRRSSARARQLPEAMEGSQDSRSGPVPHSLSPSPVPVPHRDWCRALRPVVGKPDRPVPSLGSWSLCPISWRRQQHRTHGVAAQLPAASVSACWWGPRGRGDHEGPPGSPWEGRMLPASPKALSRFLPHSRGNYPLMRENHKRGVWPHAQGLQWAGGALLEGNWKQMHGGVSLGGCAAPPHRRSYRCPKFGLSRKQISCLGFP